MVVETLPEDQIKQFTYIYIHLKEQAKQIQL